jgi:RNA polymerase sigma-70 factor (ECF subfamily)
VFNDVFGMSFGARAGNVGNIGVRRAGPGYDELADRARSCLRMQRSRPTSPKDHDALARAVLQACASEDVDLLASLLHPDAMAVFDGGGKVRALTRPVHGNRQVARNVLKLLAGHPRTTLTAQSVNGRTGLVARYGHQVAAVVTLDTADDRVAQIWVILNPDKLHSWNKLPAPTSM